MTRIRTVGLAATLLIAAAAVPGAAEPAAPVARGAAAELPRPRVVLRVARSFLQKLTRNQFTQDEPVNTTAMGATVTGTAHVAGGYRVRLDDSGPQPAFDLLVDGTITTRVTVTRRPVVVCLSGAAPIRACRRAVFDGSAFTPGPVATGVCYHSELDGLDTLRHGPAAPLIRGVARPVVRRSLPGADRSTDDEIRQQVVKSVTAETDRVVGVLNEVLSVQQEVVDLFRDVFKADPGRLVTAAATDDAILLGGGLWAIGRPALPDGAGPPKAPVELWLNHQFSPVELALLTVAGWKAERVWAGRVKPKVREQLARHSPDVARLFDEATHEVDLLPVPGAPSWVVIRFSQRLHDAGR